ncbi:MAG: proliferating cell nuclear antigen (pcna) [Candidatus Aenigmarchaeota archaeon]|nr:proliferating cell nuclear antigen (pcna) [Candidatus Aenigmarchaeota archaeon]
MLKAIMSDSSLLRDSLSTIRELIDEGIFKVDKNGLSLIAADRAMVAVVDFKLPATIFDKFEVDKEQSIAVNMTNLVSVLKRVAPNEKLEIELKDNKLEIVVKNSSTRKFTVPLLDITQEEIPPINQLEFSARAKIKADVLKNGIEDADIVSDSVVFDASKDRFNMSASGDISSVELTLEKGNDALLDLNVTGTVRARYPLDYLKKMIKASKLANEISLRWSKDYPMRMDFTSVDKVSLGFVLAPRIAEE